MTRVSTRRWIRRVAIAILVHVTVALLALGIYKAPVGTRLTLTPGTALHIEDRVTIQPSLYGPRRPVGTILSLSVRVAPAT